MRADHRPEAPRTAAGIRNGPEASARRAGRPLIWLFAGYPLWWAAGIGQFAFWIFAVPMAVDLIRRSRTEAIRLPPGFGLWALFLIWSIAGLAFVGLTPPGTLSDSGSLLGAVHRVISYLALTVLLLYLGNLPRRDLGDRAVARTLGWLCAATVAGGLLGMLAPRFEFTSPVEMLLPPAVAADSYIQALVHPAAAQIMDVLGYETPRPKAPWEYTNTWGNMLSLLLIWLIIGWVRQGSGWHRWAAVTAIAVSVLPIVYSLNRGLWAGLALSAVFALFQLVRRRRVTAAMVGVSAAALAAAALLMSPLMTVVTDRMGSPHSDDGRSATSTAAVHAAGASPIMGWGTTRDMLGSSASIAVGPSPECPGCGTPTIGSNGQFWLLLITNGWVGAALFLAFFAQIVWRYRRDVSLVGSGALLTILLLFWYMFFYVALAAPLAVALIATALLWRRAADVPGGSAAAVGGAAR